MTYMTNLILSLQITALGMGLVFGAIILLWLTMVMLTRFTVKKESALRQAQDNASDSAEAESTTSSSAQTEGDRLAQVALIAVGMALADQETSSARPLPQPPTAIISAWQLGMRTRQMTDKGNIKRHSHVA